jgi:hypothetical protein
MANKEFGMNINLFFDEENDILNKDAFDINILKDVEDINLKDDDFFSQIVNYNENYTVKELLLMCEYYGFVKELKSNKCNKKQIIQFLVDFESDDENLDIVLKRKTLWFYINEIKNDKFMKKYILW